MREVGHAYLALAMKSHSSAGKSLLSNYIRHANTHNKICEEREMWEKRKLELSREDILPGWRERAARRGSPLARGHLISDGAASSTEGQYFRTDSCSSSPYYWTRELMKAKEKDPTRWGHSGYKEQHPEEFVSSPSDNSDDEEATPTTRKRKREHTPPKAKKKLKKSKKSKKSHKHKKKDSSSKAKKSQRKRTLSTDS